MNALEQILVIALCIALCVIGAQRNHIKLLDHDNPTTKEDQ